MDAIRGLLKGEATLNNAVEIESYTTRYGEGTLYAEQRTGGRTEQPYAGYDYDSHPGNARIRLLKEKEDILEPKRLYSTNENGKIIPTGEIEDDTDIAPAFVLCLDNPKTISGIVWEDENSKTDGQRVGDGIRNDEENKVQNVKVELYNADGTKAQIYNSLEKILNKDAIVYTDADGKYKLEGLVTGKEYFVKYTYGNDTEKLNNVVTTINGNIINARNYKSTVITDNIIKNIMNKDKLTEDELKWPITHKERRSIAVDYMIDRLKITDLTNKTYDDKINMTAYTKEFILPLENDNEDGIGEVKNDKDDKNVIMGTMEDVTNEFNKFDFGIIERPREQLIVQKTITYFKISLANGQILTEGNPNDKNANISYAKTIGFYESITAEEALKAIDKRLLVEIDSELIQSAQLEVTYEVRVKNNNEIDSDYGTVDDYEDIVEGKNKYISTNQKAEYYYFGTGEIDELTAKIKYVDYLSSDLVYNLDTNTWDELNSNELVDSLATNGYIGKSNGEDVLTELKKGKYRILVPSGGTAVEGGKVIEIRRRDTSAPIEMKTSKLLALNDDNTFYNHAEIIEIDAKTARTIKGKDEEGNQIEYKPGNYIPTTMENTELDDNRVNITITPPTGLTNNTIMYIIEGLISSIAIVAIIIFIKRKVLIN